MKKNKEKKKDIPYWKNQEPPKKGTLYIDPLFPPNENSLLGLDSNGKKIDSKAYKENEKEIKKEEIVFMRASEIFKNKYKLFSEKIEMEDVNQGSLGDCYFLSSVANLCKFPGLIKGLFKSKETSKDGFYEIILYIDGKQQIVIVDDFFPVYRKNKWPCYAQPNRNELWVMLLEKAWAKINGGYINIIGGLASQALEALTGFGSLMYNTNNMSIEELNKNKSEIIKNIKIAQQSNCLISCATAEKNAKELEKVGLIKTHAYTLIQISQIYLNEGKTEYLFKLRNPWGNKEWNGDWSDKSNLWSERLKNQLNFKDKDDGIFFMNEKDFFNYFKTITICYILYNSTSIIYTIEGEESLKDASVFNIETENEGFLSVSVLRKNWRTNRELREKQIPTHISIVKYNPNETDRLKIFSDYNGTYNLFETCTLNIKIEKGNYLIYVYRYLENNNLIKEKTFDIKITCSSKFKHAQMSYDKKNNGFPLLQNIILQAEFNKRNINPTLGEDISYTSEQIGGNGIIAYIYYNSSPGLFIKVLIEQSSLVMLAPSLGHKSDLFYRVIPSGKYFVLLGLIYEGINSYSLKTNPIITDIKLKVEYDDNDIDLNLYTNINNDIKNENFKQRKTKKIKKALKEFYFDVGDGKIEYKSFNEIEKLYYNYIKLFDEIPGENDNPNLKWGIIKGDYVLYIGQFKDGKKEGKGLYVNPNNIFAGEFKDDKKNGIGYTFNKLFQKVYHCNYVNGLKEGKKMKESDINKDEKELKKFEKELNKNNLYNYENGERYQGNIINNNIKEGKGIFYYNNGDKYIGDWKNNLKEGKGIFYYNNGDKYIGDWKNDKREGKGKMFMNNGNIIESNWKNDVNDGKVILYYNDGTKYEGDYKNNKKDGKGIFYYNNGDKYDGEWKNDKIEGRGTFYCSNGEKYDGDWKADVREGKGTYFSNDGVKIYDGDWKNNKFNGKGVFIYNNGDKYEGDWKDDQMEGKGIYYSKNGKYDCEWKNGIKEGKGKYYNNNEIIIYEGDYKNDKKDGKGIYYLDNGDKYDGNWKEDKMEGKGIFYWKNGEKYEGDWKEGKMDGKGVFYYKNGKYDGNWKNNVKEGKGILYYDNGERYEGDWKEGKIDGKGIYYYNNGKYDGDWKNGIKEGRGIFYLKDGSKVYEGDWKNNMKEGKGIFYYSTGKYDGYWKNDKKDGKGIYYLSNGEKYDGDWKDDQMEGKGVYYLRNGEKYDGDWKQGKMEGKGIYYYNNGKYDGDWKNGIKEGKGIYYLNDGNKLYEGDWKNNMKEGKGIFYYNTGKYDGNWINNKKNGKGIFYWINGEKYDGEWKNDIREGKGNFIYKNGRYEGDWKNDKRDGKGNEYLNNGEKYEGDWKEGKMDGKGIYYYKNGKYDGNWKNGIKEGKGIFYYSNGKKAYEGDWKEGKMEGKGIFYYNNGKYDGDWKNNKKDGKGTFYWDNGEKYEGDWKNDLREGIGTFYNKDGLKQKGKYSKDKFIKVIK